jgi:hypothetical protein
MPTSSKLRQQITALPEVRLGAMCTLSLIAQLANASVATCAENASDYARNVVMINHGVGPEVAPTASALAALL